MRILNLGCGSKVSSSPDVVNIDWSIYLRIKKSPILMLLAPAVFRGERRKRLDALPDNILVHNLAAGIPFPEDSVDVVYHSHVLEHLDRDVATKFLIEAKRVLKPGGVQRIVVPDLERLAKQYVDHIAISEHNPDEARLHDDYVVPMLEQSVRREASGTSQQMPMRRFVENLLLGDARRRGETHQWMYDRITLSSLLRSVDFKGPQVCDFTTSTIPNWESYRLDLDENGNEYKPGSLYIEARK